MGFRVLGFGFQALQAFGGAWSLRTKPYFEVQGHWYVGLRVEDVCLELATILVVVFASMRITSHRMRVIASGCGMEI